MEDIIISFCVPSYNRSAMTKIMVDSIFEHKGNDIEVIVVDNCSTDDTVEILGKINDPRLRVIVNKENIGVHANMAESLRYGRGLYSFMALSREKLIGSQIADLIQFLKSEEFALVYCGRDYTEGVNEIWEPGIDAVKKFGYNWLHPTGFIFNTKLIQQILSKIDSKNAYELYLHMPQDFWAAELALKGPSAIYRKIIRKKVEESYLLNNVSSFVNKDDDVWFSPNGRIKQFEKYMSHLSNLSIGGKEKSKIFTWRYRSVLVTSTITYREKRSDPAACAHYSTTLKKISLKELMSISAQVKKEAYRIAKLYGIKISPITKVKMFFSKEYILFRILSEKK